LCQTTLPPEVIGSIPIRSPRDRRDTRGARLAASTHGARSARGPRSGKQGRGEADPRRRRDEVIAYLEHYADSFELPIEVESPVRSVQRAGHSWLVEVEGRTVQADNIVIATGPFQLANVPAIANDLSPDIVQLHSTQYRRPSDLPSSAPVLVVGGGNTGYQIAKELAATHPVPLAVGSRQMPLPQRPLGRDLFWWLTKTRLIGKSIETRIGRRASQRDSLIGSSPRQVRRHGVGLKPRAIEAHEPPSASRMARDSTSMQ
jgi:putative flavoprotein involved in K+ transport